MGSWVCAVRGVSLRFDGGFAIIRLILQDGAIKLEERYV